VVAVAGKKPGRKPKGPTPDDVFKVTGLTRDDLSALAEELYDLLFDRFPHFLDGLEMTNDDLVKYLEGHGQFYLPPDLVKKLRGLIAKLQLRRTRDEIKRERWNMVRKCKDVLAWYWVWDNWTPYSGLSVFDLKA
jgi:hypothetical protein